MSHSAFSLLVISLTIFFLTASVESAGSYHYPQWHSRARAYLEAQCQVTLYPKLCVECFSTSGKDITSQGPQEIAQFALMASLVKARYTKAYVSQVANHFFAVGKIDLDLDLQAVKDCLNQINDGVDQIVRSIQELRRMGSDGDEKEFIWHQSNVESWVSAALTDATTCIDGFPGHAVGGKVRVAIKVKVLNVAQLTSNALALFNRFIARHRASHALNNP